MVPFTIQSSGPWIVCNLESADTVSDVPNVTGYRDDLLKNANKKLVDYPTGRCKPAKLASVGAQLSSGGTGMCESSPGAAGVQGSWSQCRKRQFRKEEWAGDVGQQLGELAALQRT